MQWPKFSYQRDLNVIKYNVTDQIVWQVIIKVYILVAFWIFWGQNRLFDNPGEENHTMNENSRFRDLDNTESTISDVIIASILLKNTDKYQFWWPFWILQWFLNPTHIRYECSISLLPGKHQKHAFQSSDGFKASCYCKFVCTTFLSFN